MGTRVKTKSVIILILLGIVDAAIPLPVIAGSPQIPNTSSCI